MALQSDLKNDDGRFCVCLSVSKKTHSVKVSPLFIKGMPVLKIQKKPVPLCKHHFVFRCPKYILSFISVLVFAAFFTGCLSARRGSLPYTISGQMTLEPSLVYSNAGLELYFTNLCEKSVVAFSIAFCALEGEESGGFNFISLDIEDFVLGLETYTACVSLDEFFDAPMEEPYDIEYIYVDRIEYEDGSVWDAHSL